MNRHDQPVKSQPSMAAEPATVESPKYPNYALTTYEIRDYRRQLEHALKTLPGDAEVRALLQERLAEVLNEQRARAQLRQAGRAGTVG